MIEAEHLLLALARDADLQGLGLDHEELVGTLAREEEQSLASVGVIAGVIAGFIAGFIGDVMLTFLFW